MKREAAGEEDFQRLEALRRAWQLARVTSNGLRTQLIEAEQQRTRAAGHLASIEQRARYYPQSPARPGIARERRNAEANARAEHRRQLRETFKDHPVQLGQALVELDMATCEDLPRRPPRPRPRLT